MTDTDERERALDALYGEDQHLRGFAHNLAETVGEYSPDVARYLQFVFSIERDALDALTLDDLKLLTAVADSTALIVKLSTEGTRGMKNIITRSIIAAWVRGYEMGANRTQEE